MKKDSDSLKDILTILPLDVQIHTRLSIDIAHRLELLMKEEGLTKKQFAEALGRRPSEVTKWLSGEHNFTIGTLAMLSAFFNKPIIKVSND